MAFEGALFKLGYAGIFIGHRNPELRWTV